MFSLILRRSNIKENIPKYALACATVSHISGVIGGENKIRNMIKILYFFSLKIIELEK